MAKKAKRKLTLSTAKKRLSVARTTSADMAIKIQRHDFIDKFTLCDVTCKAVLESYAKAKGTYKPGKFVDLNMKSIPHAMNYFGLSIPKHVLNGVFGGTGQYKKRGTKSAKKLRDGIVHAMNKEDISEVVSRYDDLMTLMDTFLSYF